MDSRIKPKSKQELMQFGFRDLTVSLTEEEIAKLNKDNEDKINELIDAESKLDNLANLFSGLGSFTQRNKKYPDGAEERYTGFITKKFYRDLTNKTKSQL